MLKLKGDPEAHNRSASEKFRGGLLPKMLMIKEHFDPGSVIVIVITFLLFVVALFSEGFTHDVLLEAGVFLVSVKLIFMGYKNSVTSKRMLQELEEIKKVLSKGPR